MKKYVFISNSTKPLKEKYESQEDISLTNVTIPCVSAAHNMGYDVFVGINRKYADRVSCDFDYISFYCSDTYRNPLNPIEVMRAYKQLKQLLRQGDFDVIHCNTPIGGLVGRLCGKKHGIRKIIYTAHGFHFYKGAPLLNWLLYYPIEHWLAHYTDAIITINQEDYQLAQKKLHLRKNGKGYYVHGVGVDTQLYRNVSVNRLSLRESLGLRESDFVLISMGDMVKRKNYEAAIRAVAQTQTPDVHYLICGQGPQKEMLEDLAYQLGVGDNVHFLGYRSDIRELLQIADAFLFTTLQEGLPRSMMEAMASGLPVIASKIRGNVDLIEDGKGGYLIPSDKIASYAAAIRSLQEDTALREEMREYNLERIRQFDISIVEQEILRIYHEVLI